MIEPTSCPIELDRQRDTSRNSGGQTKEETKAEAVADSKNNRVRDCTGKQSQRTVLSPQQIVGEVEAA
jgi:hypothetical protein